jgi:glycosyltransferase involved in cell wall biosynthesis
MARVIFIDPYHGPSHAVLSRALRDHSRHDVTPITLPPRKWKWRMRGAALSLEPSLRALPAPDLLIATDMLNLPELVALMRDHWGGHLPVIVYFHENQLTYPVRQDDERDLHFGLANVHTALAADKVIFNSAFHRDDFLAAVPLLFRKMPDERPAGVEDRIRARSDVLGLPLEIPPALAAGDGPRPPWILWNHRWEEDKDPAAFFRAIRRLDASRIEFSIVVAGQSFREQPSCFADARRDLDGRIAHWGWIESHADYLAMAARCRVVVSTARHEFYGLAVREAIGVGCRPILPRRVVYPELVAGRAACLYDTEDQLVSRLREALAPDAPPVDRGLVAEVLAAAPGPIAARWDEWIDVLVARG